MTKVKLKQLQRATLKSQGLSNKYPFGKGKNAVLLALKQLGYIQIDTISVVERAHHHTLWTRIPDYKKEYLNELVQQGKAFEYWFHAASYLPMKDFRYALPQMSFFKRGESKYYNNVDAGTLTYVYDKIRIDGPQKAKDFESSRKIKGGWWNWKPAKVALEKLFMQGDLMICSRNGMEKIYDLTERVLPDSIDTSEPTTLELAEYLVKTCLRAYGITNVKQITHLRRGKELRKSVAEILQAMLGGGIIQEVQFDGKSTHYVLNELLEKIIKKPSPIIKILSPFDNAIIHRDRAEQLFNFSYRLESYTPKAKRVYGYFSLPILFGDEFIGRVDCKAHRKQGQLELVHLSIENTKLDITLWIEPLIEAVKKFAKFNGCKSVQLTGISAGGQTEEVRELLNKSSLFQT